MVFSVNRILWLEFDHCKFGIFINWQRSIDSITKFATYIIFAQLVSAHGWNILKARFQQKLVRTAPPGAVFDKMVIGFAMVLVGCIEYSCRTAVQK